MLPFLIVVCEPGCQVFEKFGSRFISLQVDSLVLQCPPESFDKNIVLEAPFAVHTDLNIPCFEDGCEGFTGKLAPLVGVEDFGCTVFEQCFFKCLHTESGIQCVGQSPGDSTLLVAQSMIAIRYINPLCMGI